MISKFLLFSELNMTEQIILSGIRTWANNIKFNKDESIHTENSHKYSKNNFIKLVNKSGFKVLKYFADKKNYFGVFLLKVK